MRMGLGFESGCGNEGSVVECGDNLQREINGGHDVGHDGLEKPKGRGGYCAGTPCDLLMDRFDSGLLGWLGNHPIGHGVAGEPPLTTFFFLFCFSVFPSKRRRFGGHFLT
jgi:hypothetical protein